MSKLIVVCGEPGVGKSRVARHINKRLDGKRLATDEIRKDLFGPEPDYTKKESQQVYDEMFDRARNWLIDEVPVVLDATFMLKRGRERANKLAQQFTKPYDFTIVRVTCEPSVAKKRIRQRENSASDADVDVYRSIRDRFEPVELPHIEVDNSGWWFNTIDDLGGKDLYTKPSYYQ